jgi:hypothetical protein
MDCGETTPIDFIIVRSARAVARLQNKKARERMLSGQVRGLHQARFSRIYAGNPLAPASWGRSAFALAAVQIGAVTEE